MNSELLNFNMKHLRIILVLLVSLIAFSACSDHETYADKKKKERSAILQYIAKEGINVISEETFAANGYTTDTENNEFVLFQSNGVYMQIIREGCGEKLQDGETATVLCRFTETNILGDSIQLSNQTLLYSSLVDKMTVENTSGTFTSSFIKGQSLMYSVYGTASVPSGWLVPFSYIKLGRPVNETDQIAKVRLIVPHTQGQAYASQSVYPCHYELTFERGRN